MTRMYGIAATLGVMAVTLAAGTAMPAHPERVGMASPPSTGRACSMK